MSTTESQHLRSLGTQYTLNWCLFSELVNDTRGSSRQHAGLSVKGGETALGRRSRREQEHRQRHRGQRCAGAIRQAGGEGEGKRKGCKLGAGMGTGACQYMQGHSLQPAIVWGPHPSTCHASSSIANTTYSLKPSQSPTLLINRQPLALESHTFLL